MTKPHPIMYGCIRNIRQCTFGWIDHNFLHRGFLNSLSQKELLLYYFLITVADRYGVSFYDYERICRLLKLDLDDYLTARNRLCDRSLIAYKDGVFQVLALPTHENLITAISPSVQAKPLAHGDFKALKDILEKTSQ